MAYKMLCFLDSPITTCRILGQAPSTKRFFGRKWQRFGSAVSGGNRRARLERCWSQPGKADVRQAFQPDTRERSNLALPCRAQVPSRSIEIYDSCPKNRLVLASGRTERSPSRRRRGAWRVCCHGPRGADRRAGKTPRYRELRARAVHHSAYCSKRERLAPQA